MKECLIDAQSSIEEMKSITDDFRKGNISFK